MNGPRCGRFRHGGPGPLEPSPNESLKWPYRAAIDGTDGPRELARADPKATYATRPGLGDEPFRRATASSVFRDGLHVGMQFDRDPHAGRLDMAVMIDKQVHRVLKQPSSHLNTLRHTQISARTTAIETRGLVIRWSPVRPPPVPRQR